MELSLSEQLCYCTVRIECTDANGQISTGTGFFFNFEKSEGVIAPIIVTNRHVLAGMSVGKFIMTKANLDGTPDNTSHFTIELQNIQSYVKYHPDSSVDLCALTIAPILRFTQANNINVYFKALTKDVIPTQQQAAEFGALEDILMIGYPNGIWDVVNNMPILRRGSTATHPCLDYCGKKEFMIDAACFPGSSGSPVFIFNPMGYANKTGGFVMSTRIKFVGVLYAGPQHTATGEIVIVNVPTAQQSLAFSRIPNNLGIVIKSERVLELEPLFT